MDDREQSSTRQLGRAPRAFRRVAARCPFGAAGGDRAGAVRRARRAVPDDVLPHVPHLVAAVSRLEAAAGSSAGARRAAAEPELRDDLERRDRRAAPDPRGARRGQDRGRRRRLARRRDRGRPPSPESLKCLHAHVAFALARPGYRLGERVLAELRAAWPAALLHARGDAAVRSSITRDHDRPVDVASARSEWEEGSRRFERALRDRPRADRLHAQVDALVEELRRRVGQTFTLAELAGAYAEAERWAREVGRRARAVAPRWPRTLALVERRRLPRLRPRRRGLRSREPASEQPAGPGAPPPLPAAAARARTRARRGCVRGWALARTCARRRAEPGRHTDARADVEAAPPGAREPADDGHGHRHRHRHRARLSRRRGYATNLTGLDHDLQRWVVHHRGEPFDTFFEALSLAGSFGIVWLGVAAVLAVLGATPACSPALPLRPSPPTLSRDC